MLYLFISVISALVLLSYTQVDLNLTLLNWEPYLEIQKNFTQLGYFQRPLNATLWLGTVSVLAILYFLIIKQTQKGILNYTHVIKSVVVIGVLSIVSYNALSHDLFNYIFDAKMITTYHVNPYQYKALDFPQDPWIRFMQWTHRTYPYGPVWLGITAVPSFLGLGKFLPTFILFKALFAAIYIGCCIYIGKIAELLKQKKETAVALFAFHPLIILDGLISPRIDMAMLLSALVGIQLVLSNRKKIGFVVTAVSAGIKFATILFLPILLFKKQLSDSKFMTLIFGAALVTTAAQTMYSMEVQPWYTILPIGIAPLLVSRWGLTKVAIVQGLFMLSIGLYIYFLYSGTWLSVI